MTFNYEMSNKIPGPNIDFPPATCVLNIFSAR